MYNVTIYNGSYRRRLAMSISGNILYGKQAEINFSDKITLIIEFDENSRDLVFGICREPPE